MPSNSPTPSERNDDFDRPQQNWIKKFAVACRGVKIAVPGEASFSVHLIVTVVVLFAAAVLGVSRWEWCLIVLCIAAVLSAELFNTSVERVAKTVTQAEDQYLRDALDIASGAVLVIALGAAVLGVLVLGPHFFAVLTS